MNRKKKILIIATSQITIESFLKPHILRLKENYDITVLTKFISLNKFKIDGVKTKNINIYRNINIINDIKIFFLILNFLKIKKFDLIFTITPKAGLVGMLSSFIQRVPNRIHIFTGQVWSTKKYLLRHTLKIFDKLISLLATEILCDSKSQRSYLYKNSFKKKIKIVHNGSICGVDTNKFKPNITLRKKIRKKYNILNSDIVFLYVGRINEEKGIYNIIDISKKLYNQNNTIKFIFVGKHEDKKLKYIISQTKNIYFINHSKNIHQYFQLADIYITSSYREGFGISVAQAMSCCLPVIGPSIYGLKDLLLNNKNSLTFDLKDINKLLLNCKKLVEDKKLRIKLGSNARKNIQKNYEEDQVINAFIKFFKKKIN